jgi:hypothetical protein
MLDSTGTQVKSGGCSTYSLGTIPAGDDKLVVDAGGLLRRPDAVRRPRSDPARPTAAAA